MLNYLSFFVVEQKIQFRDDHLGSRHNSEDLLARFEIGFSKIWCLCLYILILNKVCPMSYVYCLLTPLITVYVAVKYESCAFQLIV
jgi:hypothetical protein